jgi:hypothetical protein
MMRTQTAIREIVTTAVQRTDGEWSDRFLAAAIRDATQHPDVQGSSAEINRRVRAAYTDALYQEEVL